MRLPISFIHARWDVARRLGMRALPSPLNSSAEGVHSAIQTYAACIYLACSALICGVCSPTFHE